MGQVPLGRTVRCTTCKRSFIVPADVVNDESELTLREFPIVALLALNVITGGLYSLIHLCMMHDRLPKVRDNDPSSLKALGLCLVPIVNVYGLFFTFHRLCLRINEQRRLYGLRESAPGGVALAVAALTACSLITPWVRTTGLWFLGILGFVLIPVFAAMVQMSVNELVRNFHADDDADPQHNVVHSRSKSSLQPVG
jgi:hypothetical protein